MASKSLWLRLYTEVLNDPKVQRLDGDTFKGWVNLLCVAKESSGSGTLPTLSDIAFYLRTDANTTGQLVQRLIDAGLIDQVGEYYIMHGWNLRQYESDNDPTAIERKRRERDRKRDVTDMSRVTSRTSHGQCHTNVTRTETETETETDRASESVTRKAEVLLGQVEVSYPITQRKLAELERVYSEQWLIDCFDVIIAKDKKINKPLGYAIGILKDWKLNGKPEQRSAGQNQKAAVRVPDELELLPDKL